MPSSLPMKRHYRHHHRLPRCRYAILLMFTPIFYATLTLFSLLRGHAEELFMPLFIMPFMMKEARQRWRLSAIYAAMRACAMPSHDAPR